MTMSSAATADSSGVRLKRKVLSAETKLFEWRPCSCSIMARDGKLLLQLQTPPQDEDNRDDHDSDTETITIDLATQLLNVVPKKNKARCDLEYYAPVATMSRQVLKEELMAPSATHCQQWIAQI
ncbi:ubiquitin carboxyl-terminal hydrolase 4 [Phytophthora cinnamomi]|uniref:ubiquitin carboxyl-terminal hydrolase 4 n=1 Tax=Phytophthora cinnamomi TaxID=4785 RepID=UPI00355A5686|nr:ubiquitin carboxyl-terminal hydrolase 4 [Phytophthora cinnamomi]